MLYACGVLVISNATPVQADEPKAAAVKPRLLYTHTIKEFDASWIGFSKDGSKLFIVTNELTPDRKSQRLVVTLDAATGKELRSLRIPGEGNEGAVSPDGTQVVLAEFRGDATIYSMKDGTALLTLKGHKDGGRFGRVMTARFSPDGTKIVTGGGDYTAKLWDVATGKCLATFAGHTLEVASAEFSADGKFVATGSYNGAGIKIWDIAAEKCVRNLVGMSTSGNTTHFMRDGKSRLSAAVLDTSAVWNVASGESVQVFKGHDLWVRSARFDPTGKRIVTAGLTTRPLRVWDAENWKGTVPAPEAEE